MGFSRQGYWSGLPFASPGDFLRSYDNWNRACQKESSINSSSLRCCVFGDTSHSFSCTRTNTVSWWICWKEGWGAVSINFKERMWLSHPASTQWRLSVFSTSRVRPLKLRSQSHHQAGKEDLRVDLWFAATATVTWRVSQWAKQVRRRRRNIIWQPLLWSLERNDTSELSEQNQTHRLREITYGCCGEGRGEGIVRESGVDMDTLLCLPWRTSKDFLDSPGNSAQYSVIIWWSPGGRMGEGTVRESGMDMDTQLCLMWRTSKDLLHSPGNSAQYSVITWWSPGGRMGEGWGKG